MLKYLVMHLLLLGWFIVIQYDCTVLSVTREALHRLPAKMRLKTFFFDKAYRIR